MHFRLRNLRARIAALLILALLLIVAAAAKAEAGERRQLVIAVTHQLRGAIGVRKAAGEPSGLAHIAPLIETLRRTSPDLILVDAGGTLDGRPNSTRPSPPPIVEAMGRLHYDAAALEERTLALDRSTLSAALRESVFPWLGANLDATPSLPHAFATRVVERGALRIGFIGLAAPSAKVGLLPSADRLEIADDTESIVRQEAAALRNKGHADVVVVLGGGGRGGTTAERETAALLGLPLLQPAGRLADSGIDLDLIIASRGRAPRKDEVSRPNRSMRIPFIEPAHGPRGLTVLRIDLERIGIRWVLVNLEQETLWASAQADRSLAALGKPLRSVARTNQKEPLGVYIAGRASRRRRDACAGAVVHSAVSHTASKLENSRGAADSPSPNETGLSLLPYQWNWPRYTKDDRGRPITRRELRRWIPQDDSIVESVLTGRQIALMLQPYARVSHGWTAPRAQVLFPVGWRPR